MDYYATLGITKEAGIKEVTDAFRVLALEHHTLRELKNSLAERQKAFGQICEAYEVLSNPEWRKTYDESGIDALKNGISSDGMTVGGYVFSGDSQQIFKDVLGTNNPFIDNFIILERAQLAKEEAAVAREKQPEPIEITLSCSIFEFYNGSLKTINYTRKGLTGDGKSTEIREETFQVEVKPGYSEETVIKFPTRGNQMHGSQVSALIVRFELEGESDTNYRRNGDDLVYAHQMSLADAMECKPFQVQTLDKRQLKVAMDQMPTPQLQYVVAGEGMPKLGQPGQKGDLTVKFEIVFPEQLTSEKRAALLALLA